MGAWRAIPLVPPAAAFAVGIAAAPWLPEPAAWSLWLLAIGGAALGLAARSFASSVGPSALTTASVLVATVALGTLRAAAPALPPEHAAHLPLPRDAKIVGRLAGEPTRWAADRARLLVDLE